MAITFERTQSRYRGQMARGYEAKRKRQQRWHLENEIVERYLSQDPAGPVLDVPVGTGRFLDLYEKLGLRCYGIDASEEMLALARKKRGAKNAMLKLGNALSLDSRERSFGTVVCVRFLDLIPDDAMRKVLAELCRVARHHVILTIRLGESYVHKSNTCTHDRAKFYRAVRRLGWQIDHATPIFRQGWEVILLSPIG